MSPILEPLRAALAARMRSGIMAKDIAAAAGISASGLSRFASRERTLRIDALERLARVFGMRMR